MLQRNPEEGRKVIQSLLKGPIILTPVETPQGKRFRVEADAVPGKIFCMEGEKPPPNFPALGHASDPAIGYVATPVAGSINSTASAEPVQRAASAMVIDIASSQVA